MISKLIPSRATAVSTAVLVLLLTSTLAPLAAGAADGRNAELAIDQPHYIDSGVETRQSNGTTVYVASGEQLDIFPQNFDSENVVNYGVTTQGGEMNLNPQTGAFVFKPSQTGTYNLFFVVERTTVVETSNTTANNSTTNSSTTAETVTEQVRYEAAVRVEGGLNLVHQEEGSIASTRVAAENWRDFNSTIHGQDLVGAGGTGDAVEEMISWYTLRKHPQEALTGGVVGYLILGFSSTAVLVWVVFFGGHAKITRALRKRLHIFEATEAEEGSAKEAVAELDRQEKQRAAQNTDWNDLPGFDDHVASAFREVFGETVHDGTVEYLAAMLPGTLIRDRLQAMGHDGYVAVVDERAAPDGGDDGDGEIVSAHLAHGDDVDADADVVDLVDATEETVEAVATALETWDDPVLTEFELVDADYDAADLETTYESMDIRAVGERLEADMRYFDSPEAYGEYLQEFLASVEEGPECDTEGRPDEIRYIMSHFLKHAQVLDDRFDFPLVRFHREAIERALVDFDPEAEARDAIEQVKLGGGA